MSKSDDKRLDSLFANEKDIKEHSKSIKIAFIGYGNDEGVARNGGRIGAAAGPQVIRTMLKKKGCVVNEEFKISLDDIEIRDFGDTVQSKDLKSTHKSHEELVLSALNEGYIPILVGGGNDQSYPNFMALLRHIKDTSRNHKEEKLLVVNIDAHLDVRPLLPNDEPHSGSPFRQILETCDLPLCFVEFGCQGSQCSSNHVDYVHSKGGQIIWLSDMHGSVIDDKRPLLNVSQHFDAILNNTSSKHSFISFDVDSIRCGDCPGVSCPSPLGLTAEDALAICYRAGKCGHVRLLDVSEFNPSIESYMTATLIANMIYYFLIGIVERNIPKKKVGIISS